MPDPKDEEIIRLNARIESLDEMTAGSYEIKEPVKRSRAIDTAEIDTIAVPGVAFDLGGGRLGYGKGYYDRFLKGLGCAIIALAYEFQVLKENLPLEEHDVPVQAIVTEKRVIRI